MEGLFLFVLFMITAVTGCAPKIRPLPDNASLPLFISDFRMLSYNIHGLPPLITGDNSKKRVAAIGRSLNNYPLVLLQEDFVYHQELLEAARHPAIFRGNGSRFGIWGKFLAPFCGQCGSGLTIMLFGGVPVSDHGSLSFGNNCSGWLAKRNDCWATKGFQWLRMAGVKGTAIFIYNTHLDSGTASSDRKVRVHQLSLLTNHIEEAVAREDSVFLGGDFNAGHAELEEFVRRLNLKAACDHMPGGIDHIFYRAGAKTEIVILEAGYDIHIPEGLSDHKPIFARFRIG